MCITGITNLPLGFLNCTEGIYYSFQFAVKPFVKIAGQFNSSRVVRSAHCGDRGLAGRWQVSGFAVIEGRAALGCVDGENKERDSAGGVEREQMVL